MNNKLISVIIVLALIALGVTLFKNITMAPTEVEVGGNMPVVGSDTEETAVIKEFRVDATSFLFTPSSITVNQGDIVKINVKNVADTHDLTIDEFNVSTRILKIGEEETITFVADKTGTFQFYCSVGNHRVMGMIGVLTVR